MKSARPARTNPCDKEHVLPSPIRTHPAVRLGLLAAAAALSLTACSPNPPPTPTPTESTSPQPSGNATTQTGTVRPGPSNNLDRRKHVTLTGCESATGGWKASGKIANDSSDHEYSITVYFTNDKATNPGEGSTKVEVEKDGNGNWTVTGKFEAPEKVLCVLGPVT